MAFTLAWCVVMTMTLTGLMNIHIWCQHDTLTDLKYLTFCLISIIGAETMMHPQITEIDAKGRS